MKKTPFFSICIPTYNRAHLLPAALDSALAQTDSDYEIVIVDNASTDNTQEVLKRYEDSRIRIVRNSSTLSQYANHNICIKHAQAPWVVFLHSDDRLTHNALERYRDEIQRDPSFDIITGTCDYYLPLWKSLGVESRHTLAGNHGIEMLFRYLGLNMPGSCFKRAVFNELGGFDENCQMADHDLMIRALLERKKIKIIRQGVIEIGLSERTTNKLMEAKSWLFEHGCMLSKHASNPEIYSALAPAIKSWQPSEFSRILMFIAGGNDRITLNKYEKIKYPLLALAKKEKYYMHVRIYKLLGHRGHRLCMKTLATLQRYWRNATTRG